MSEKSSVADGGGGGGSDSASAKSASTLPSSPPAEQEQKEQVVELTIEVEEKESFASKLSYILLLVGYAVGFGNIWRFPYLMQKNGGIVFLIPYSLSLAVLGVPTFFLELAIGQRLRKAALHAWNDISPFLGGIGIASAAACCVLGFYYNTLIAYCLFYFFSSFQNPLPWHDCNTAEPTCCNNETGIECRECKANRASSHYWYETVLKTSEGGLTDPGRFNWPIFGCLAVAWFVTWAILVKGIKTSGKVAYVTALLPYVVLVIFFIRGLTLEGMEIGYEAIFKADWDKLLDGTIWFEAGTQIFFSLGLGFGILVSFSALLPANNNCYRDALAVSFINCGTSLFAATVVFPTLGYKGLLAFKECTKKFDPLITSTYLKNATKDARIYTYSDISKVTNLTAWWLGNQTNVTNIQICDLMAFVTKSASGPGLIFIAYTEAIAAMPYSQMWSILFFLMVLSLGIDSGFTTVEGAIIAIHSWNLFGCNIKKWKITTGVCLIMWAFSFVFCWGWAEYVIGYVDTFTVNWTLLLVGFFECIGVAWVYGLKQFSYDIYLMTGSRPNWYMMFCWRFISPVFTIALLIIMTYQYISKPFKYDKYNHTSGGKDETNYPPHAIAIGLIALLLALGAVPLFAILAAFKIHPIKETREADFPENDLRAQRNVNETDFEGPAESTYEKIMYWGSSTDLRRRSTVGSDGEQLALPDQFYDASPTAEGGAGGAGQTASAAAPPPRADSEESFRLFNKLV